MEAHVLDGDGKIINTIVVRDLNLPGMNLYDASIGGCIGDSIIHDVLVKRTGTISEVPKSATPRQIRQAMSRTDWAGGKLREAVEAFITNADQDTRDWYEFATEFLRDSPVVAMLAAALGVTNEQLDALWRLAATL